MDYPVTLERDDNGTILVSFPDFPEAHTFGEDEADALVRAKDALATAIDAYISTRKQKHGERPGPCPRGRLPNGATIVDRMSRKLLTKTGAAAYAARKGIVEPVIGQIKHARGFRQFLLRGFEKVHGEWSLVCTTHNILKLYRLCV